MAIDVEDLLSDLGRVWNASVPHVAFSDVVELDEAQVELRAVPHLTDSRPGSRRLLAATAAVAAALVLIAVVVRRDDEGPPTITIPSSTTTTVPLPGEAEVGAWSTIDSLSAACSMCRASALLGDDRVIIVQGSAIQIFDPTTATFSLAATFPENLGADSVLVLTDKRALLTGINGEVALFDPADNSLQVLRDRLEGGATNGIQLADGRVLLFGARIVEALDLESGAITPVAGGADAPRAEAPYVLEELTTGRVFVGDHIGAHVYNVANATFSPFDADTHGITNALRLDERRLLVVGTDARQILPGTSMYDIETGAFTPLGSWRAMTLLPNGDVLAYQESTRASNPVMTIHNLTTGEVTAIPPPNLRHWLAEPVALSDGRLLIFGDYPGNGFGLSANTNSAEIFVFSDER